MKQSFFQRIYRSILGNPVRWLLKHPLGRWFVVIGSIVYLLSPVDIIPDFPIVGWIDDGLLATLVTTELTGVLLERRRHLKAQKAKAEAINSAQSPIDTQTLPVDDRP